MSFSSSDPVRSELGHGHGGTTADHGLWLAPHAAHPVSANVFVPGSKSLTNRFLILAALAREPSRIASPLDARDTRLMSRAVSELGASVMPIPDGWQVSPGVMANESEPKTIDCGLAGTVLRFVPALAALTNATVRFVGDASLATRPVAEILEALRHLGVTIAGDTVPFTVRGAGRVRGGDVGLDATASSQLISGLLLAGARFEGGLTITHTGGTVPSLPHIDMTMQTLSALGIPVSNPADNVWRVEHAEIPGFDVRIEPDLSTAAPFLAAAVATEGAVTVPGWPAETTQAGDLLRGVLERMGARVSLTARGLSVRHSGPIHGVDIDASAFGELVPVVAALAALAQSPSQISGVAHLRGHETDRLAALSEGIGSLGGDVRVTDDGLIINPVPLRGGVFATRNDHRLAHAGAILGLRTPEVYLDNVATAAKTLPGFSAMWSTFVAGETDVLPPSVRDCEIEAR